MRASREDATELRAPNSPKGRGRLGAYTMIGAAVAAMPLPWLPDLLRRRVRGALVHDVAVRHGVSLTAEARAVLSEPSGGEGPRGLGSQALSFLGVRLAVRTLARFGPIAAIWPARDALRTYVLGHLFARYLTVLRSDRAVRIDAAEAQRVRRAIDGALARAITVEMPPPDRLPAVDDHRDAGTVLIDGLVDLLAGLPDRMLERLDAAFDQLWSRPDG